MNTETKQHLEDVARQIRLLGFEPTRETLDKAVAMLAGLQAEHAAELLEALKETDEILLHSSKAFAKLYADTGSEPYHSRYWEVGKLREMAQALIAKHSTGGGK